MRNTTADKKMREQASRHTRSSWPVIAVIGGLLLGVYLLRYALIPFVLAGALAYILSPAVRWMHGRLRFPRTLAAVIAWMMLIAILSLLGWAANRTLVPQFVELASHLPQYVYAFLVKLIGGERGRFLGHEIDAADLSRQITNYATAFFASPDAGPLQAAGAAITAMIGAILTFVLLLYYLISAQRLKQGMLWLVPPHYRPRVHAIALRMDHILNRYIVGLLMIASYAICVVWIVTRLVAGLHYATILSLAVGLLELMPIVGPAISTVLLSIVALQQGSVGAFVAMGSMLAFLRLSIDEVIGPLVLGRAVALHPVVVILSILVGGVLFGFLGVLLAVPASAAIRITLELWYGDTTSTPQPAQPAS